ADPAAAQAAAQAADPAASPAAALVAAQVAFQAADLAAAQVASLATDLATFQAADLAADLAAFQAAAQAASVASRAALIFGCAARASVASEIRASPSSACACSASPARRRNAGVWTLTSQSVAIHARVCSSASPGAVNMSLLTSGLSICRCSS